MWRELGVALDVVVPQWLFQPAHIKRFNGAAKALASCQAPFSVAVSGQRHVNGRMRQRGDA
jgi:hypothetical protein